MKFTRRKLIIGGTLSTGALVVGWLFAHERDRLGGRDTFKARDGEVALNGWVKVSRSGTIIVAAPRAEMGQGIHTALAALVAEEMDAKWRTCASRTPPTSASTATSRCCSKTPAPRIPG